MSFCPVLCVNDGFPLIFLIGYLRNLFTVPISPGTSHCSLLSPSSSQAQMIFSGFWDAPSAPAHEKCDHTHWEITSLDSFPRRQISWVQWIDFQSSWPAQSRKTRAVRCAKCRERAQSQAGSWGSFPPCRRWLLPVLPYSNAHSLRTACWLHPLYKDRRPCPVRNWNAA